jgi:hypothetical protein
MIFFPEDKGEGDGIKAKKVTLTPALSPSSLRFDGHGPKRERGKYVNMQG